MREFIRADALKVGDVFYTPCAYRNETREQRVTGVGKTFQTYGWRGRKTRHFVRVVTDEVIIKGHRWDDVTIPREFTFSAAEGVWVNAPR